MSGDTLLAHLASRFAHGSENLATEALAFLLRQRPVADAFHGHLHTFAPDLPDIVRFRTQVGGDHDAGIRDLVGSTADHTTPLVVEVKFDAPLTSNQPQTYLRALADLATPSLLLFLVPSRRAESLWPRLRDRCAAADLTLEVPDPQQRVGRCGQVTLAVTTWKDLLDDLSGIDRSANEQVLSEIVQLRGLCDREDRHGWRPFDPTFLDGDVGQHLLDLDGLIDSAVERLHLEGVAEAAGYKWTAGRAYFGRYLGLEGRQALLHVNLTRWGTQAATPLWLRVWNHGDPRVADALAFLAEEDPRHLFDDDGRLLIPIRLQPGTDRDQCLELTVDTIRRVHDALRALPPDASSNRGTRRDAPLAPDDVVLDERA